MESAEHPPIAPPEPEEAQRAGDPGESASSPLQRLANALAHEVRNPLVPIRTFAELLPERFEDPEFRERFVDSMRRDVGRLEALAKRLSELADLSGERREPVDVALIVDGLLAAHRDEMHRRKLVVLTELDRGRPFALGDREQLEFAFEALVEKALALVPERGDLYFASRHHPHGLRGEPSVRLLMRFQSPGTLTRQGSVEGISVAESSLEFLLAEEIIRSHGGTFALDSTDSREALVVVDLPAPS